LFLIFMHTPPTQIYTLSLHDALPIFWKAHRAVQDCTMIDWDDIRYFLAVARGGSVRAAAQGLGVNHSTVLRRIAQLEERLGAQIDRKSTRLNSSHDQISYAVFCLKKK